MCTMNPDLTSGQRLMAESQHMGVEVKVAADKLDRLEAQNAKLRDMVAVLWECCACNTDSFWCEGCDYHDVDGCKVRGQIDRLGIEVDG